MPAKNLFDEAFDDGTQYKLRILEDYFREWLPVFISSERTIWKTVRVFDFFAGRGTDKNGTKGSPLIIIEELNRWKSVITKNGIKIEVVLNEYDSENYQYLIHNLSGKIDLACYDVKFYNEDFKNVFERYRPLLSESANFLFLDQNGIKQITESIFSTIISFKQTDFIFFISSSFIKRFADLEAFSKYLKITKQDLQDKSYYHIHRIVMEYYRNLVPKSKKFYLAPFSIKKPAGIYGLIFGSNHIYGLEKFLTVCWKHDSLTGEANFDIDSEKIDSSKPSLFMEYNIPKKIQIFENKIRTGILNRSIETDIDLYMFTLEEGFLPKHVNKVIVELKKEGKIDSRFNTTSSKVHKIEIPTKIPRI